MHETAAAVELAGHRRDRAGRRPRHRRPGHRHEPAAGGAGRQRRRGPGGGGGAAGGAALADPRPLPDPHRASGRLAGTAADPEAGRRDAQRALESGDGLEGSPSSWPPGGDLRVADDLSILPQAPVTSEVPAPRTTGWRRSTPRPWAGSRPPSAPAGSARTTTSTRPWPSNSAKLGDRVTSGSAHRPHPGPRRGRRRLGRRRGAPGRPRWSDHPTPAPPLVHGVQADPPGRPPAETVRRVLGVAAERRVPAPVPPFERADPWAHRCSGSATTRSCSRRSWSRSSWASPSTSSATPPWPASRATRRPAPRVG